jgi:hypothetical protein
MIVVQCKACENLIRFGEDILTTVICQKCGGVEFTFDGECEFTDKNGQVTNIDSVFTSVNPHMYSMKRAAPKIKKEPVVKVFKKEPAKKAAKKIVEDIRKEKPRLRKRRPPIKK